MLEREASRWYVWSRLPSPIERNLSLVRCNAAIPLDHKDFQNQYLFEDPKPDIPAPKKLKVENKKKLEKWKKALL